jgi:glutamate dehydrogenase
MTATTGWSQMPALSVREATVLRAYARYLRQAGIAYSQEYIALSLNRHS